ncbi:unnamed protein product [Pleuronectes platessa]|uniref:Uncharacterized protein n=1 Tax=Pleuronectes platessa TaxID=8262 RepID=A0A9N7ULN1_PLEPL|nr:unnamed protein product [Pleuronectes platessa]
MEEELRSAAQPRTSRYRTSLQVDEVSSCFWVEEMELPARGLFRYPSAQSPVNTVRLLQTVAVCGTMNSSAGAGNYRRGSAKAEKGECSSFLMAEGEIQHEEGVEDRSGDLCPLSDPNFFNMAEIIQFQIEHVKYELEPGDDLLQLRGGAVGGGGRKRRRNRAGGRTSSDTSSRLNFPRTKGEKTRVDFSTMSVLIATQLKIDTSTPSRRKRLLAVSDSSWTGRKGAAGPDVPSEDLDGQTLFRLISSLKC